MLIIYIYFLIRERRTTRESEILIITNTSLFIYNKLIDLAKKRRELKFIINYIYKFKIF